MGSDVTGLLGSVGTMAANIIGNNNANEATQKGISNATNTINDYYGQANVHQQPYAATGQQYLSQLQSGVDQGQFTAPQSNFQYNYQQNPGYQNQLTAGNQNIKAQGASAGSLFSGATLRNLQGYGSNMANASYNQGYGRALNTYTNERNFNAQNLQNKYKQYMGLVNIGQNAANNLANQNMSQGQGLAGLQLQSGAANAGRNMGNANAVGNMMTDLISFGGGSDNGRTQNTNMNQQTIGNMGNYGQQQTGISPGQGYGQNTYGNGSDGVQGNDFSGATDDIQSS